MYPGEPQRTKTGYQILAEKRREKVGLLTFER